MDGKEEMIGGREKWGGVAPSLSFASLSACCFSIYLTSKGIPVSCVFYVYFICNKMEVGLYIGCLCWEKGNGPHRER
jgi:hypothetical protein